MTIALKIAITSIALVTAVPIEYILFPKLDRAVEKGSIRMHREGIILIVTIVNMLVLSVIASVYLFPNDREIWYSYLPPMVVPIFWHFVFACTDLQKRLLPVVLPILTIAFIGCIILPIRDDALKYEPELSNSEMIVETKEPLLSETEIKARLNATSISEPSYYGGKYIYEINKGTSRYGLALVDAQKMEFLPCKYENQISGIIREHYPKEEIVQFGIEIRDEVPYAKFGILKRSHMFSKPKVDFYVLLDMRQGKMKKEAVR